MKGESLTSSSQSIVLNEVQGNTKADNDESELESKFQEVYTVDQNTHILYNYPTLMPSKDFLEREADSQKEN